MPKAIDRYFYMLQRRPDQTLLQYCGEVREAVRDLEKHKIILPKEVQGYIMLKRSGLSPEQLQLILSQVGIKLAPDQIEQSMYFLLGQDHKASARGQTGRVWQPAGNKASSSAGTWRRSYGSAHVAEEEQPWMDDWAENDEVGFLVREDDHYYDAESGYLQEDDQEDYSHVEDEQALFEEEPQEEDEAIEEAYASYLDARRRLAEVKASRGFFPVVAMVPPSDSSSAPPASYPNSPLNRPPKGKGKAKGTGRSQSKARPPSSGKGSTTCLRCGQVGHWCRLSATCFPRASPWNCGFLEVRSSFQVRR